ncbi:MAG TPA: GAF domain-containing sensor histidine kinase [Candidatus Udaeobacter sp.]|jgi:signal transduction histidine kinase|nr:GAF domain-containing sensor histidine kinase [Candidatus Udaeobacter sp.]
MPHREAAATASRFAALTRRGWLLWCVTFLLLIALTSTIPLLYWALLESLHDPSSNRAQSYLAVVGLTGLVLLFCLYTALKQHELERTRTALAREEREKEDIRTRLSELSELFEVSTTLNLQLKLEVILEIIVRRVVSTLRAQQASIMIIDPESGVLETRASYGLESEFARNARKRLGEGIAGWVAQRQEAVLLNAQNASETFVRHYKSNRNITSALSLPLKVGDRCVGVLNVNRINHPDPFKEHHRDILRLFAEHVGTVIDRAEIMDRLGERNRELEESVERLNEINRLKDVFLATASHELKTPLTAVIAYAELLSDHEQRLDERQQGEFLSRLRGEAQRLLGLIEEILDLSRIESGKMALRRVRLNLASMVRDAVETTRPMAGHHDVRLIEEAAGEIPEIEVDEVKVRQSVVNLLVNAIKFSPAGGEVRVRVAGEPGFARIEVNDHGPGIAPEDAVHLFEMFGQGLRPRTDQRGGLGIGLHLVKRLIELHGGHVGVNSTLGEGSTFWIRLPLQDASTAPATDERRAA